MIDANLSNAVVLECRGVTKRFGALVAVKGIDLLVERGESIGIGGPNGAGKTTLFDLISGLTPPSSGSIRLNGEEIVGVAPHRVCHRGMMRTFQLNSAFDNLTVFENLLAAQSFGRRSASGWLFASKADREAVKATIAEMRLESLAAETAASLPILARKKLMVATALVNQPDVLLLDEPVGGLTPTEIDAFIDVAIGLKRRGLTLVFIEHVMHFLMALADRAIIMHQGGIIYDGDPKRIGADPMVREVYLGTSLSQVAAP